MLSQQAQRNAVFFMIKGTVSQVPASLLINLQQVRGPGLTMPSWVSWLRAKAEMMIPTTYSNWKK